MSDQKRQKSAPVADRPQDGMLMQDGLPASGGASAPDGGSAVAEKRPGRLADTEQVIVDNAGRLVVPAKFRRALGIRGRTELVASLQGDSIRLRTVDAALDRLRGIAMRRRANAGRPSGNAVEAFIAGRGHDAEKE